MISLGEYPSLVQPDSIEIYTVTFLCNSERYLLLQRSPDKTFAPMRWTGLGGKVELDELSSLRASALREVWEETGIAKEFPGGNLSPVVIADDEA